MHKPAGFYVQRKHAIVIGVLFVLLVVGVGLLAGLVRAPCNAIDDVVDNKFPPPVANAPTDTDGGGGGGLKGLPAATAALAVDMPWDDPFLPQYTWPTHYEMYFDPDFYFDGDTFTGTVVVTIHVDQDAKHLLIHHKKMVITSTDVTTETGTALQVNRTFAHEANQYWVTELVDVIAAPATVKLHLDFSGSLVDGIVGYYKSTYVNADTGIESWLATTKFQPSDSRKAFPNFDEPRYKATFDIKLRHWQNFTALSNMPVASFIDTDTTWRVTTFQTTPIMSSYLVAFIVCDFLYRENLLEFGNKSHRVWATPDKIGQVQYGLEMGKNISDYLAREFDMGFHLPKLDEFAVPDYPSGATEHWGLITYRQGRLLYDAAQVGDYDRMNVASIIAHELVHNYFGDVVTCLWWDDLWLNEGFASYYSLKAMDNAEPEYGSMNHYVVTSQQSIMTSDAGRSSRPLIIGINSPDEANSAFDRITYDKGSAVLRMMEGYFGVETVMTGLKAYLKKHEYGSVITQDLLDSLQTAVGDSLDVTTIMLPWLRQTGLPFITISVNGGQIEAKQSRLMTDPRSDTNYPPSIYGYKWHLALDYVTANNAAGKHWMNGNDITFDDPRVPGDEWIKFNREQMGYYRVKYPNDILQALTNQLTTDSTKFSLLDRSSLIDDALGLARAGHVDYPAALNITLYMTQENTYEAWRSARGHLEYISSMFYKLADYSLWRDYVKKLVDPIMTRLEVKDTGTYKDKINRQYNIIRLACSHGHVECLQNTTRMFVYWVQNDTLHQVPTNIREVVYSYGMQSTGGDVYWNILWDRYEKSTSVQDSDNILYAMTRVRQLWLIQKMLDYAMDRTKIRAQDFFSLVSDLSRNREANRYVWDWARANYEAIVVEFGIDNRYLGQMIPNMVSGYNTEVQLSEVVAFFTKYPDAGTGERRREEALDSIRANIDWIQRSRQPIVDWLKQGFLKP